MFLSVGGVAAKMHLNADSVKEEEAAALFTS